MERNILKEINLDYLYKINMPDNRFGIEIEFAGALFRDVEKKLNELFEYETQDSEKRKEIEEEKIHYEKWNLVDDSTVQENNYFLAKKGGEINTPIMRNRKKYWQELEQVCKMLRKREYIRISDSCAVHIHTETEIFKELQEFKNLLKLFITNEDIIYRFGYGEKDTPRESLLRFAKPFSSNYYLPPTEILKNLDAVETKEDLVKLLRYERKYGLNLRNIINNELIPRKNKTRTIELRIFNGTLNENIIQNELLFNMCLLDYCKTENFDTEFIDYQVKNYEPIYINESLKIKEEKADRFFYEICKNELNRLKLLKQYYKEYNEFDIEKSIHL